METQTRDGITISRDARHVYRVEGDPRISPKRRLTSVTTVLGVINKPALVPWSRRMSLERVRATLLDLLGPLQPPSDLYLVDCEAPPRRIDLHFTSLSEWIEWVDEMLDKADKRPDEIKDEAGDIGTRAHGIMEGLIKSGRTPDQMLEWVPPEGLDDRIVMAVGNFAMWYKDSGLTITESERMVYHPEHLYAGTMDAAGTMACPGVTVNDGPEISHQDHTACCGGTELLHVAIDFKTSNGLYNETAMQIAAYAKAHEATGGPRYARAVAVRFGKVGADFEAKWLLDVDASFVDFVAAKQLHGHALKDRLVWVVEH